MAEVSTKQRLDELLEAGVHRRNFAEVLEGIYSSFKTVDWASAYLKGLIGKLESASEEDQRNLHEQIGILAFALGRYEEAVEHLSKVKTRKDASHFLGRTHLELERTELAREALEAGKQGEDDFETDMFLADSLCRDREAERARKLCEAYRKSHAEDARWLCAMGRVLEAEGAYDEAMEHYEQALQRDPNHRDSLFRLALNHDLNGEDDKAVELYQRCALLSPTCLGALLNLGVLYEDREQYGRAVECYRRVLAIEPNHKRALLFLKDAEASLTMRFDEDRTRRVRAHDESLQTTLSNFELSARSRNVLERLGVKSLGDLTRVTEEQLLEFKNFGETSLDEIKDLLARNDLQLAGLRPSAKPIARELPAPTEEGSMVEKLSMPVDLLGLATRCRKCMERLNITRVGELIQRSEEELLDVPNFGRTSVMEIKSKLAELGLSLKKTEGE